MDLLKDAVKKKTSASLIYDDAIDAAGGPFGAAIPGDLPRSRNQIRNLQSDHRKTGSPDPVNDLLMYARDQDEELVMNHTDYPSDTWILGTDVMRSDLKRFTTSQIHSYPLSVDPTFNMGKFEVTPIVTKNILLKSVRTGEHPVFLGPTMIHHRKDHAQYKILSSSCVSQCKGLNKAKGFVTDREKALQHAFHDDLKTAKSLRCFRHFEGNCRAKLNDIGIKSYSDQKLFLEKTFGVRGKAEGILDAEDKSDLRNRLDCAKEDLEMAERRCLKVNEGSVYKAKEYVAKFNKLSVDDVHKGKEIPWPKAETQAPLTEYKEASIDVEEYLQTHLQYSPENAAQIKDEVNKLLNHPHAIQRQPSLDASGGKKFEVASKHAKHGRVEVCVYKDHTVCNCGRFKHDKVCKHSIAVAELSNILKEHFQFINKRRAVPNKTALVESNVNAEVAGKKGSRNRFQYRPQSKSGPPATPALQNRMVFTEIYHNNNPFIVQFLTKESKACKSCEIDFPQLLKVIPFDIVLSHKERWYYPVDGDWSRKKGSTKETTRYYHVSYRCIKKRFPYFTLTAGLVHVNEEIVHKLKESHKKILKEQFSLIF